MLSILTRRNFCHLVKSQDRVATMYPDGDITERTASILSQWFGYPLVPAAKKYCISPNKSTLPNSTTPS